MPWGSVQTMRVSVWLPMPGRKSASVSGGILNKQNKKEEKESKEIAFHSSHGPARKTIPRELTLLLLVAIVLYYLGVQQDPISLFFRLDLDVRLLLRSAKGKKNATSAANRRNPKTIFFLRHRY